MTATDVIEQPRSLTGRVPQHRKKLFHLQALRGLAASLVVISHCADTLFVRHMIPETYAGRLGISGYFGVVTFFIISGFIIYKTSRASFGHPREIGAFVVKRLIRIFPVYWLATALFVVLDPHRSALTATDVLFSLALIPHVIPAMGNMHPIVGQGWTLQYEILFYALFAASLVLPRRLGLAAITLTIVGLVALGSAFMPLSDMAEPMTLASYWTRPIMLLFPIGIGFGLLEERIATRLSVPYPFTLMLAVLLAWFAYSLGMPLTASQQIQFPTVVALWALAAVWVFISIFGRPREGWVERVAEGFGDASYSVYLFHAFILSALVRLHVQNAGPVVFTIAALIGANAFGYVMFRLVERPVLQTARRTFLRSA